MRKLVGLTLGACLLATPLAGCSMGRAVWYEAYTADGGNWERTDLNHGRVGSAFSNAGVRRTLSDQADVPPPPTPQQE